MTRNIVLVAINLLIAAVIGGNAALALMRGCDFGGRCSGASGMLTWILAIGLPLLVAVGIIAAATMWVRARRNRSDDVISISTPQRQQSQIAEGGDEDCSDAEANDVMSARLARTTSAAHIAEAASTTEEVAEDVSEHSAFDTAAVPLPSAGWSLTKADQQSATKPVLPFTGASAEQLPAQQRPFTSAMEMFGDHDDEPTDDPLAWLIEPDGIEDAPHLRTSSGFPWVVAGIDHVCVGMARLGGALAGSDFPSEASAWRQVVRGLPRHQPLAGEDAAAFTHWLNGMLDMTGPDGLDLIEDALHELAVEAATDPAIALALPTEIGGPIDHDQLRGAMRLSK